MARTSFTMTLLAVALLAPGCTSEDHCHGGCGHGDGGTPVTDDGPDPVTEYCNCMLINCHEPFHDRWGEGDPEALAGCSEEAGALPRAAPGATSGDSLECRRFHCERAAVDDMASCPAALGDEVCQ